MDSSSPANPTGIPAIASDALDLSLELNDLQQSCGHESTAQDISSIAQELMLLSDELGSLEADIASNQAEYTTAFSEDLTEILNHLQDIFEDISDCCTAMRKADGPNTNAVGWFHKKRYVHKLQKHLAANNTTLVVMRTVLHHGKNYGKQNSPGRLAESSPHTLKEDWAILESVFASRSAIADLRDFANKAHEHHSSSSSAAGGNGIVFQPGPHGRNLSNVTGVDSPTIPDVLPESHVVDNKKAHDDVLARRFSKRGVRLAVHSAILDLDARDVPSSLRRKWIAKGYQRSNEQYYPSIAQLSNISEVDSNHSQGVTNTSPILADRQNTPEGQIQPVPDLTKSEYAESSPKESKAKKRSMSLITTPMGQALGKVISRLSNVTMNDQKKYDNQSDDDENREGREWRKEKVDTAEDKNKSPKPCDDGKTKTEKTGWTYRLTKPFMQPELTTPDFNKDMENYR